MLNSIFTKQSQYYQIKNSIEKGKLPMGVIGLANVCKAHYISSLSLSLNKPCVVVCASEAEASRLANDLLFFAGEALIYRSVENNLITTAVSDMEYQRQRLGILKRMLQGQFKFIVTTLEAASQFTIPPKELTSRCVSIKKEDEISLDELVSILTSAGYGIVDNVESKGQFSKRGGILDIFTPENDYPVRIEFWGDEVTSIAYFDIDSQRRGEEIDFVDIMPCREVVCPPEELANKLSEFLSQYRSRNSALVKQNIGKDLDLINSGVVLPSIEKYISLIYPQQATLFDYIPSNSLFFVCESRGCRNNFDFFLKFQSKTMKEASKQGEVARGLDNFNLNFEQIVEYYNSCKAVFMDNFERGSYDTQRIESLVRVPNAITNAQWNGTISSLVEDLQAAKNSRICIVAGTSKMAQNVADDLTSSGYPAEYYSEIPQELPISTITVLSGGLSGGFEYPDEHFMLISYRYGGREKSKRARQSTKRIKSKDHLTSLDEINIGDYVVHSQYGIGIFKGIDTYVVLGNKRDCLKIEYSDGNLLVSMDKIETLTKYKTPDDSDRPVRLNSFSSTKSWEKTKQKVSEDVKEVARNLANIYAKRMQEKGYSFGEDDDLQNLFETKFEYEETADQLSAIGSIKHDMQSSHPMDRLLLGDVGYGKTEVALRAVFKCVEEGKQCAILVPTTILALQHYQTMLRRFEGFPVSIEMMSRFRTQKQKNEIKKRLANGTLDVIVGTHGLLADSVKFHDLGLLVVDEEQRFGVKQKEKMKKKFPLVDTLTISATPIPRTLNMAMSGIRDMSMLEIPPQDRHAVATYVMEYDLEYLVRQMKRELDRGGQVYYLLNNIDMISKRAEEIQKFLPDARIAIGHGQMSEEELSEVWRQLIDNEIDILVCTTIIETGVDVPNANTLIVENASRLGLAQMHQIRGRVGRSSRRAYAYFTYDPFVVLKEQAAKRLKAIEEFTGFGAGYHVAMRDLEIRGAGEILGTKQHGHMSAVGFEMYVKMLNEAVEELGNVEFAKPKNPSRIQLNIDMSIPETYIQSYGNRIEMYKRILSIKGTADANDVLDEIVDRFGGKNGKAPKCVTDLVKFAELKARATEQEISEIRQQGNYLYAYSEKMSSRHAIVMKQLFKTNVYQSMEGLRKCMRVPLRGANSVLVVAESIIRSFEYVEQKSENSANSANPT